MRSPFPATSRSGRAGPSIGCWRLADPLGLEEVRRALAEDRAGEDVTTRLLGAAGDGPAVAHFVAEGRFVVAGLPIAGSVFRELDPGACLEPQTRDGAWAQAEENITPQRATAQAVLSGGRASPKFIRRPYAVPPPTLLAVCPQAKSPSPVTPPPEND